jgi:hypothetical protein
MNTLRIEHPPEVLWALQQEPHEFEREARLLLGIKLYESGKLTTGLAAKIAGVPPITFYVFAGPIRPFPVW